MAIDKIGKFQVVETLGSGAHSSILRVTREADGTEYALKLVNIEDEDDLKYLEQAKHEFRVGQMLNHPSLVKVHCFEVETNWLFKPKKAKLLVEYAPGKTLDKVPLLRMAKAVRVFERIADGLTHMHKQGVFHADLKPGNIILGPGNRPKVIDFGLAWVKGEPHKNRIQGTPEYLAPETASHKLISERTDIYNFGATMYRLVTLQLPPMHVVPGHGLTIDEKEFKTNLKPVRQLNPLVPEAFANLIHRCLSFSAVKRPERMSEIQGELDRLADELEAKSGGAEPDE